MRAEFRLKLRCEKRELWRYKEIAVVRCYYRRPEMVTVREADLQRDKREIRFMEEGKRSARRSGKEVLWPLWEEFGKWQQWLFLVE